MSIEMISYKPDCPGFAVLAGSKHILTSDASWAARRWVRDDPCTNVGVAAWILHNHLDETGDLSEAIAQYHSRTPLHGQSYKKKVVASMSRHGLIRTRDGR